MYYPRFHYTNPVTGVTVQYPPGITAAVDVKEAKQSSSSFAASPSPPRNVKEFMAKLDELARQIDSSIAYDAVENLVSAHGYDLEDSKNAGNLPSIYQTVQPVILLASDGKSASIRARLLKVSGKDSELVSGSYEGRATVRDGTWTLQSLALKQAWSSPFVKWMPVVERGR